MPAPIIILPTTGTNPLTISKEAAEAAFNAALSTLYNGQTAETAERIAADADLAADIAATGSPGDLGPWAFAVVDEEDEPLMALPSDGGPAYLRGHRADVTPTLLHVVVMGQSNSLGAEAFPATRPVAGDDLLQFQIGFQTWASTPPTQPAAGTRAAEDFGFSPLVNTLIGSRGQSFCMAFGRGLKSHQAGGRYAMDTNGAGSIVLFSNACAGSQYLRTIGHWDALDQHHYLYTLDDIARAKAAADAAGLRYQLLAVLFDQGENESFGAHDPLNPATLLPWDASRQQYRDDLLEFYSVATPAMLTTAGDDPTRPLPWFVRQMHRATAVAQAQLDAAKINPHIIVAGPGYLAPSAQNSEMPLSPTYPTGCGSPVHFAPDGQNMLGWMLWRAARRVMFDHRKWAPLSMVSATRLSDTSVAVRFDVPVKPIKWDTLLTPQRADRGFRMRLGTQDAPGVARTITAAVITGDDEVTFTLDAGTPITSGAEATIDAAYTPDIAGPANLVASVRDGAAYPNGLASKEIVLTGNCLAAFNAMLRFGTIQVRQSAVISLYIRSAYLDGGNTILRGIALQMVGTFAAGVAVIASYSNPYTNLIDSEDALPPENFGHLPSRLGEAYPTANACCAGSLIITT